VLGGTVAYYSVLTQSPWSSVIFSMCTGQKRLIGPYPLSRYDPQGSVCDAYMQTYCNQPANQSQEVCGCFEDQKTLAVQEEKLKVALPVTCFGTKCAKGKAYKTSNMTTLPCNLTVCQQTITTAPGVFNDSDTYLYCGGSFFDRAGESTTYNPTVSPVVPSDTTDPSAQTDLYTWILFGISAVMFLLLIFLLFGAKPSPTIKKTITKSKPAPPTWAYVPTAANPSPTLWSQPPSFALVQPEPY